ncbi:mitochondrial acidic protein mam33 isoform X1 [Cornus florida]|uniref:mitochondrial acidic protein mam33 isoform X1 n=1 Tax=Cornus florida TaxID=4283 RepID=UPI002898E519|nr:mitochondrial acidic protein mam33 isoform X1 [Cornus florida]
MPRVTTVLQKGRKALQDLNLLKILQSEISHEQSSNPFQNNVSGSLGDFVLDWDSPQSQDVVLRKKCDSGEEVAVSALLGPETFEGGKFSREALMKICIKKPGLSSILQFDCGVSSKDEDGSEFDIQNAYYIQSSACLGPSVYRGPLFSSLDPQLQGELKQYLVGKGIGDNLTNFVLLHLHKKEQGQYVNWLQKLEAMVAQSE